MAAVDGLRNLVPEGAQLRRLATGSEWAEGPVWHPRRGSVLWSDILGDRIMEWTLATGATSVYRTGVEFTNGRTLDLDGGVLQCSHGYRRVERDDDGRITPIVDSFEGKRFNSPNDLIVARDGSVWFTDPTYGITQPGEGHPGEEEYGGRFVFRHDRSTGDTVAVVHDMEQPNGLAFSPDESVLYVADSSGVGVAGGSNHHIRAYDVAGGRCSGGRLFATVTPGVPDGIRVDVHGDVWTSAGDGVQVFSPDGERLGRIPVPEVVANLCFGGPDGSTLFIAATTSLYAIDTLVSDSADHSRG